MGVGHFTNQYFKELENLYAGDIQQFSPRRLMAAYMHYWKFCLMKREKIVNIKLTKRACLHRIYIQFSKYKLFVLEEFFFIDYTIIRNYRRVKSESENL